MTATNDTDNYDTAVIGLAVMGQNLILNMDEHGYKVVAYNRTHSKINDFLNNAAKNSNVKGADSVEEMIALLARPRKIMLMVRAGDAVDATIEHLVPHLEPGDIIIDGGNSLYKDTSRRVDELATKKILYVGTGVSGGEEGARHGPSIMPGGAEAAWPFVKDILQSIAAKSPSGNPCCNWIGQSGSGHYVKMVHNGIEYGDMQLIAESYGLMRNLLGMQPNEISAIYSQWNKSDLESYLIEITSEILKHKDSDGVFLIDKILDSAGQKGTGKWTVIDAAELGQPLTLISEALFARFISSFKDVRLQAADQLDGPAQPEPTIISDFVPKLEKALYAAKIISYAQGYMLLAEAAKNYGWKLNYGEIAEMWTGGCIIRSRFLGDIKTAYDSDPKLKNLMLAPFFKQALNDSQMALRQVVAAASLGGIPVPAFSSALAFYDAIRQADSPANLIQAQRDFFGAHTYERVDKPRGEYYHTNWTGSGGNTSSSTYTA